jgi:hypothetical protein
MLSAAPALAVIPALSLPDIVESDVACETPATSPAMVYALSNGRVVFKQKVKLVLKPADETLHAYIEKPITWKNQRKSVTIDAVHTEFKLPQVGWRSITHPTRPIAAPRGKTITLDFEHGVFDIGFPQQVT